ncbi:BMP family ABC transporter substrate-binding protein [Thalassobacillus hwangdonensis]|uniref:BMP family ABC transporter substrate-binding protein n=1 Tax=Thalassobacillus hwangdonensis TaxID=546108 RepID=A0ABW3KVF8_9BACI
MKKIMIITLMTFISLVGCSAGAGEGNIQSVGMLVETTVHDQAWGQKGYKGLLEIKDEYDVDVYFKEGITSQAEVNKAVDELADKGVKIIFGHSSTYGEHFQRIHESFPEIQFIYFNGGFTAENVTSLNFSANAMGFFGGVVAGGMTETNQVGIIAAHEWQPEVEGFFEGVNYENPDADIHLNFVGSWDDKEKALQLYQMMEKTEADVFYPTGDSFSSLIIQEIQDDGNFAIGYVNDQSNLGKNTVLTSTVQNVEVLYIDAMEKAVNGELPGDVIEYDFKENAISMGAFSDQVPDALKEKVQGYIESYKATGKLPYEN